MACQFSMDKIKDDESAGLFSTGFPNHGALISFYNFIEPKLTNIQCWKGVTLLRESQPYQVKHNRKKPGPSRKLSCMDELLLVLIRLKAGLFVQDLPYRFGITRAWCQGYAQHGSIFYMWNYKTFSHFQHKNWFTGICRKSLLDMQ